MLQRDRTWSYNLLTMDAYVTGFPPKSLPINLVIIIQVFLLCMHDSYMTIYVRSLFCVLYCYKHVPNYSLVGSNPNILEVLKTLTRAPRTK